MIYGIDLTTLHFINEPKQKITLDGSN